MLRSAATFALFDDNLDGKGDLLLEGLHETIVCTDARDLPAAFRTIAAAGERGCWVALAASYELGYALEPRLRPLLRADSAPLLTAWVFERARWQSAAATATLLAEAMAGMAEHDRLAGVAAIEAELTKMEHCRAVERIRTLIEDGDCYQVNFTFALRGMLYGDALALYHVLREAQPVRHGAFIRHGEGSILSRSPELFVARRGAALTCRPMKGTAPRESDPALLASSHKNRAENVMIVDLIRNDLGRLAPPGGVRVERLCEIEPYPSVWQMTSTVTAEPVAADLLPIFRALFPCGSVTGAPKFRAMEIIRELESMPRGLYCGALGWIAPDGDCRFSVPIRTLLVDAANRVRLGLGSGIVADSDASDEWDECLLKGAFLTRHPAPFGLIETLRCEPQAALPYPLLERHLERLAASAAHFGFRLERDVVHAALMTQAASLSGCHRVRLVLEWSGAFRLTATALEPRASEATPTVALSPIRVSGNDPLSRHKTTARALYDAELARAIERGHFDALFLNERGELAEGARTNVFLDMGDGVLLTPPLESGALDGVYRRKLIAEGRARPAPLDVTDLRNAAAIHVANAARGLGRVVLKEDDADQAACP